MARQKLGQHFLASEKALERIAREACGEGVRLAVEIGPGKGALTEYLLRRAERVIAIELDPELAQFLRGRWQGDPRVEIIEGNALHFDGRAYDSSGGTGILVGNLPYYVATAIISRYLWQPGELKQGVFLIQKEVAERITARPGTRDYGYLSVECQYLATVEYLTTVAPGAFRPPPKVESAVVRLVPRVQAGDRDTLLSLASASFRQKRKTLRNNLAGLYTREVLDSVSGLNRRAEELSVSDFEELRDALAKTSLLIEAGPSATAL